MADGALYVVWRDYQRRAEVVAPRLGAEVVFLPHRFRSRALRPLDYLEKALRTLALLLRRRPALAIFQSPPVFTALPARLLGIPYLVDAHNATFQGRWGRLPGSRRLLRDAAAVVAHNDEIAALARRAFPDAEVLALRDPLEPIAALDAPRRDPGRVLPICSFGADEPVDLLLDTMARCPDLRFVVTADPARLPAPQRARLLGLANVELPGFLSTADYQRTLLASGAALVLTERDATQPSGACEALSSDTPLVLSRTGLTERLFGRWAHLVEHDPAAVERGLRAALAERVDLGPERERWDRDVARELARIRARLGPRAAGGPARGGSGS